MIALYVALGAAIGAPARYLTDRAVQSWHRTALPLGTLVVNVVASFVLGVVTGAAMGARTTALIATGFCGALSTFSTFGWETFALTENRRRTAALLNVSISIVASLAATGAGWALAAA